MRELPPGWAETTLASLHVQSRTIDPRRTPDKEFRLYSVPSFELREPETATGSAIGSAKLLVESGIVLLCKINPRINRVWVVRESGPYVAIASSEWMTLSPGKLVLPEYLAYYLQQESVREFLARNVSGVGGSLMRVKPSILSQLVLRIPPHLEQRRIVSEIERYLSRIDVASQALVATRGKVGSYVDYMFERAASAAPCSDFRHVLAAPLANGRSVPTADSGFPVLRLTSIRNATKVDLSECKIGDWDARQAEAFLVRESDLLIVRGNGSLKLVGRAGLVQEVSSPVAYPDTLIRAKIDKRVALPAYVVRAWHTRIVRNQIERAARTSAGIYKINQSDIENLRIPLPPLPAQRRLASLADAVESLATPAKSAIDRSIQMSARLRQAILKKAFEGKLVLQDPNDEPASVLLERIRAARANAPARRNPRKREVHA